MWGYVSGLIFVIHSFVTSCLGFQSFFVAVSSRGGYMCGVCEGNTFPGVSICDICGSFAGWSSLQLVVAFVNEFRMGPFWGQAGIYNSATPPHHDQNECENFEITPDVPVGVEFQWMLAWVSWLLTYASRIRSGTRAVTKEIKGSTRTVGVPKITTLWFIIKF